ncbi:hypothetical protein [Parapedobacter lycopersici]|uniref:hypothetical protein n=1 Tax=Parapedobacter lycopersici TaxID=1864939 RepID=UPI00214D61B6|nr:hypothetical protein [Parapedobacter lycopersici]
MNTEKPPEQRIYNDKAIGIAAFIGGPLTIGYAIAQNFKVFNQPKQARWAWIIAVLATALIFGSIILIPALENVPNALIPIFYTSIGYVLAQHYQGKSIEAHKDAGGLFYTWKRAVGVGVIGLVVTMAAVISIVWLVDQQTNGKTLHKTYGTMQHEISYYEKNLTEAEVDQVANGLITTGFFDQAMTKYVFAEKVEGNYELFIPVVGDIAQDDPALALFMQLRDDVQERFPDNKVVVNLIVEYLDNVVKRLE